MDLIVYNNVLPSNGCDQLYLNSRTSDVNFIFRTEKIGQVPAHKNILSIISPVFDDMFYGPNKQNGDIEIVGASTEAFIEFLQFFYRSQVKISIENVAEVLDLGRQYLLDDWRAIASACTDLCVKALTLDNMCMGYELAILYELDELKSFCEKQIGENAAKIFRSNSFLNCQRYLLRHILELNTFTCDESTVFDGCIAWAKAESMRKRCDENGAQNLRAQLGHLFYEIRFGDMTLENFEQRYRSYDGLFSLEEFRDITMMIARKDFQPEKFNRSSRWKAKDKMQTSQNVIVCKRNRSNYHAKSMSKSTTKFILSSKLSLMKIFCYLSNISGKVEAKIKIYECFTKNSRGTLISRVKASLKTNRIVDVELPAPILVEPRATYEIDVELKSISCTPCAYKQTTRISGGPTIDVSDKNGYSFVSGLQFVEYKT